jgi:RNA polymerase sigma-70 factor, ECF subfamily
MNAGSARIALPRIEDDLERHRAALTRHCRRMLGSPAEAEDAVQETLLRAWRGHARFERRSKLQTWLYRIATNVCIDMRNERLRRPVPLDPEPLESPGTPIEVDAETDPVARALDREAFRLAVRTAIQQLPARQRAVLFLREVLGWSAAEAAELLETSPAAVNSALQRARATLDCQRVEVDAEGVGGLAGIAAGA